MIPAPPPAWPGLQRLRRRRARGPVLRPVLTLLLLLALPAAPRAQGAPAPSAQATPVLAPVTLQLRGRHAFLFAGYYAAEAQGYYRDAGLAVTLQEAGPATDVVQAVVDGRAQFGVGTSSLLLDRQRGAPVQVLAVLFQHSPQVLLARAGSPTQGLHDLVGRRLMIEPQAQELVAYLAREGVPLDWLQRIPHSQDPGSLLRDETDAMSAEVSSAPFALDAAGQRYQVYTPRAAGIDFYGDNLFTSDKLVRQRPALVKAFREASLRGWRHAMDHPDEVIRLILQRYPPAGRPAPSREALQFEARRLRELMQPDLVEIGYMYPGRWQHAADTFADAELLPRNTAVEPLLYQPGPRPAPPWLVPVLAGLVGVSGLALYIGWINRRLVRALAASEAASETLRLSEHRLRHMAQHDALTSLPNRALFSDRLQQALAAASRDQQPLALMFLDLDHFKPVNDAFGHAVGDALLQQAAQRMRQCVRASDTVARIGGDEFVVLLRTVDTAEHALAVAAKLGQALARPFEVGDQRLQVSASIGVALSPGHGQDEVTLARHADLAMYQAKQAGRNQVRLFNPADGA